ncbi:hypothetical protein BZA77DRAFT_349686 [Pyronema omphalodes]|nr:hypothetical protein BZA77DRAFT_349686 [Pyronema omphalodes]
MQPPMPPPPPPPPYPPPPPPPPSSSLLPTNLINIPVTIPVRLPRPAVIAALPPNKPLRYVPATAPATLTTEALYRPWKQRYIPTLPKLAMHPQDATRLHNQEGWQ